MHLITNNARTKCISTGTNSTTFSKPRSLTMSGGNIVCICSGGGGIVEGVICRWLEKGRTKEDTSTSLDHLFYFSIFGEMFGEDAGRGRGSSVNSCLIRQT